MKKEISLEKLALMVAKGFTQMDKRFEQMENKLQKLSDKTDSRFNDVDRRLYTIEDDVKYIKNNKMGYAYTFEMKMLEKRVEVLEEKVK